MEKRPEPATCWRLKWKLLDDVWADSGHVVRIRRYQHRSICLLT